MCSERMLAPALVPAHRDAVRVAAADELGDRRAAEQRRQSQLVAAGEEDAARLFEPLEPAGLLAVAPRVEVHDRDATRAQIAEHLFVSVTGLVKLARGGDDDDVGVTTARHVDESVAGCGGRFPCFPPLRSGRSSLGSRRQGPCSASGRAPRADVDERHYTEQPAPGRGCIRNLGPVVHCQCAVELSPCAGAVMLAGLVKDSKRVRNV